MIFAPFVLFFTIALIKYRRIKSIDISILICMVYGISGFVAIFTDALDISTHSGYRVSFIAGFTYCTLLLVCLQPFIKYSNCIVSDIKPIRNERILKFLAWLSLFWFLFSAIMSRDQFWGVISGDMGALRQAMYNGLGEAGFLVHLPSPIRFIVVVFNMLFGCEWILMFLAFYSLTIQKMHIKYFIFFFIASLSGPWTSILGVDRSGIAIFVLSILSVIVFFWKFMSSKTKFCVSLITGIVLSGLVVYLSAITMSRFSGTSGDDIISVKESLISYLGQCYIEFCYFFDNVSNPDKTLNLIFPCISKYILGEKLIGGVMLNQAIEAKTGVFTGVFLTFMGQIQLTAGFPVTVLFCLFFSLLSNSIFRKIKNHTITSFDALAYLALAEVMILGQYSYFYQSPQRTFSLLFFLLLFRRLSRSI